ncbi:MAG: lipoyl domain-containing protein, partial [Anaerolineae bacterium]|nr:lipoyl domain-containing protein [Anaerolineae bacterium]
MPKLGLTMTHGTITEWLKAPGDRVQAEEALC